MPEPISIALTLSLVGYSALYSYGRSSTAISSEAQTTKNAFAGLVGSSERVHSLFGKKACALSDIHKIAADCAEDDWDGYGALAIDSLVIWNAEEFIRALPDNLPVPEVSAEPEGSLSLDWIRSRNQIISCSIGATNRLAFAWLDGTERGHSVINFDGSTIPHRLLSAINPILTYAPVTLRTV